MAAANGGCALDSTHCRMLERAQAC